MKKTVLALAALVMTSGLALAQNAAYPGHADAAPASVVINRPASIDHSSSASVTAVGATSSQERAAIIQERADKR